MEFQMPHVMAQSQVMVPIMIELDTMSAAAAAAAAAAASLGAGPRESAAAVLEALEAVMFARAASCNGRRGGEVETEIPVEKVVEPEVEEDMPEADTCEAGLGLWITDSVLQHEAEQAELERTHEGRWCDCHDAEAEKAETLVHMDKDAEAKAERAEHTGEAKHKDMTKSDRPPLRR